MTVALKPFVLNIGDVQFLLDQVNLVPLFDAEGHLLFNWDGTSAVYTTAKGATMGAAALFDPATSTLTADEAVAAYGRSYYSVADAAGTRDVQGVANNLNPDNAYWGAADVPFLNVGTAGDLGYGHYLADGTVGAATGSHGYAISVDPVTGTLIQDSAVDTTPRMISQTIMTGGVKMLLQDNTMPNGTVTHNIVYWDPAQYNTDNAYKSLLDSHNIDTSKLVVGAAIVDTQHPDGVTFDAGLYAYGQLMAAYGIDSTLTPGQAQGVEVGGVMMYLPYIPAAETMVQQIDAMGLNAADLTDGESYYDVSASPWGLLAEFGVPDRQNPANGEYFIESQNPGVAPTNGFFAVFGQFFDHGLDFIGKGESGSKITIPLDPSDPLYGVIGQDGRPTTSITIGRANVAEVDENGVPLYVNHTSPFIDQSQTYGSNAQITQILREWVEDPNNPGSWIPGTRLLDGDHTVAWTDGYGNETTSTLPTLNELRSHVAETGRDAITWEDVLNLRARDAQGHLVDGDAATAGVQTVNSGHAMLLDMNPHVDGAHLLAAMTQGDIDTLVTTLNASVAAFGPGNSFAVVDGVVTLNLAAGLMGPNSPAMTLTGVSAMAPWINFANFEIHSTMFGIPAGTPAPSIPLSPEVWSAVSDVMMSSVGDHYVAGDGRVNENVALTSIHHIFHMEHDYQVQNLEIALFQQDALNPTNSEVPGIVWQDGAPQPVAIDPGADTHGVLHSWQTAVTAVGTASNALVADVDGHWEATGGILARDGDNNFYVVANATGLPAGHSIVTGRDGAVIDATGSYTDANGYVSWDQEKVFQGTKIVVEMEYQHTAVDQYARAVSPDIPEFSAYSTDLDGTVNMFYSQGAFRFGHSTLRETIDTLDPTGDMTGRIMSYALEQAFLNPALFEDLGAASLVMGMTRQVMNDIDEFITPALQQGLLGLPLDLAAINIARGRDVGLPTMNQVREQLHLSVFTSWNDFGQNLYHPESLVNFIAAYSFDGDVTAAQAILDGAAAGDAAAVQFLNGGDQGFNKVDLWTGGLAEAHISGGLLGETFNVIFVDQIQRLMDGDRFYYLYRLAGTQFGDEIINEQFKDMVERNTGTTHLNGNIFGYSDVYYELGDNPVATERLYDPATGPGDVVDPIVAVGQHIDDLTRTYYDADGVAYIVIPRDLDFNATAPLYDSPNGDHSNAPTVAIGGTLQSGIAYVGADGLPVDMTAAAQEQHKLGLFLDQNPGLGIYTHAGDSTAGSGQVVTINGKDYVVDLRPELDPDALNTDGTPTSGINSNEVLAGTDNADLIYLGYGDDTGYADGGDDVVYGGGGGDRIYGGEGNDILYGDDAPDVVDGGDGDDIIYGGDSGSSVGGFDQLIGGAGDDKIYGGVGIDKIYGNGGDDAIYGGADTDPFIFGGDGADIVDGGDEQDNIYGNAGDDLLIGGNDKDILFGQEGDDILRPGIPAGSANAGGGNTGNAVFGPDEVVGNAANGNEIDTGFDLIDLSDNTQAFQVEVNLDAQANPLILIDQNQVLPTMIEIDGIVGTQAGDVIMGNADGNWLIGAGGGDTFEADIAPRQNGAQEAVLATRGGNDVIVGGAIRLDALIGKYGTLDNVGNFVADAYDTAYALLGANHRVAEGASLIGGLLNGTATAGLYALHFTDMLRSFQFKDLVLGSAENQTGNIGDNVMLDTSDDTVVLSGNFEDYSVVAVDINGDEVTDIANNYGDIVGVRLTDNGTPNADPLLVRAPTDGTDLVIGVESFQFADGTHTLREVIGSPPTLALSYDGGAANVLDTFDNRTTTGSAGTANWTTPWIEANDGTGTNLGSGQIQMDSTNSGAPNNTLAIGSGDGASISRVVDLGTAQSATISFDYREFGLSTSEYVTVRFSPTGNPADFVTVTTITGDGGNALDLNTRSGTVTMDLTGPFSADAVIEITTTAIADTRGFFNVNVPDYVAIDNLKVDYVEPVSNVQTAITQTFTEDGAAVAVAPRARITDMDGTTLTSATVVLTNAKAGDDLTWTNGTAGGGFSITKDASVAGQITVTLSSATPQGFDAFASHLAGIRFSNSSQTPDTTPRVIETVVNDGRLDSAPATTTVNVVAVNDAPQAQGETIISNIASGTPYLVPTWALLDNDADPDGPNPLSISAVTENASNFDAALQGQNVAITHSSTQGRQFTYTVTDGLATDTQSVTVNRTTSSTLSGNDNTTRDILIARDTATTMDAGTGDDIVIGGAGNDSILWFANNNGINSGSQSSRITDGRDFVDGGAGTDTFTVKGNGSSETFQILTTLQAIARGYVPLNATTEIMVIRNGIPIAELDNIEELIIDTTNVGNIGLGAGTTTVAGDTIIVAGDFAAGTSLAYNTIHVNGSEADDTVDITGLTSAHRVVFDTQGGDDQIIGDTRPQDVMIRPENPQNPTEGSEPESSDAPQMLMGTAAADVMQTEDGADLVFGGNGADLIMTAGGADQIYGDGGADRIFAGSGDDYIVGGRNADLVFGGEGDDVFVAVANDGDDVYHGDEAFGGTGSDTLDMSAMTAAVTVDLGTDGNARGSAYSAQTGHDVLYDIENVRTGFGDDVITASTAVNVIDGGEGMDIFRFTSTAAADGDTLSSFQPGDTIDLSGIDANGSLAGQQHFTLVSGALTGAGQLMVSEEVRDGQVFTLVQGTTDEDDMADFTLAIRGSHHLGTGDFSL